MSSSASRFTPICRAPSTRRSICPAISRSTAASRCTISSMPGSLNLDDDAFAALQHGSVGLPDRRRGQGLEVERRELLLDGGAQLALDHDRALRRRRPDGRRTAARPARWSGPREAGPCGSTRSGRTSRTCLRSPRASGADAGRSPACPSSPETCCAGSSVPDDGRTRRSGGTARAERTCASASRSGGGTDRTGASIAAPSGAG